MFSSWGSREGDEVIWLEMAVSGITRLRKSEITFVVDSHPGKHCTTKCLLRYTVGGPNT